MELALRCMSSESLSQVVLQSIGYLEAQGGGSRSSIEEELDSLRLEDESEHLPLQRLAFSRSNSLLELAQAYIHATRYLFPILHLFSYSVRSLSQGSERKLPLYLFMRDALAFWPCLHALQRTPEEQPRFVFYSRKDERVGRPPILLSRDAAGAFSAQLLGRLEEGLLVDAGLYGSLIHSMIKSGRCAREVSVMFLGSRNPFLAGWFNMALGTELLHGGSRVDLGDTIRLVDTVESLLKPFRILDSASRYALAGPRSFTCAMALMWALYRYSASREGRPSLQHCLESLREGQRESGGWWLARPVPRWEEAERFIADWDLGPLPPMRLLCGLGL